MRIVDITDDYTLGVPNQILGLLAGDYDGDVLNVHYIINEDFRQAACRVFSARNSMMISRNDGWLNTIIVHNKDLMINMNTLNQQSRKKYTPEQLEKIRKIKELV